MAEATFFRDAILRPGRVPDFGVLFPGELAEEFLVRRPSRKRKGQLSNDTNALTDAAPEDQRTMREDALVRLPSLRVSKWKVTVLQAWTGRVVEHAEADRFVAVLTDTTNSKNPPEEVELDLREVSNSDLPLLKAGATFYWSIGYRDTPGGQRERVSTLRFARLPRLNSADVNRVFEDADHSTALLESD
jgi:hypothetical protein